MHAPGLVHFLLEDEEEFAVDLDGTLAKDSGWKGPEHIGDPVPKMLNRVKAMLADKKKVVIFTARAHDGKASTKKTIEDWLKKHGLPKLEITNEKRPTMVKFYDDKAEHIVKNKGVVESDCTALLRRAAQLVGEADPDYAEDGCAEVSSTIVWIVSQLGCEARVVYGHVTDDSGSRIPHAWIQVGNEPFDPSAFINKWRGRDYVEDASVAKLFSDEIGWMAEDVLNALRR